MTQSIPKRIFIVPYRNRLQQKFFFEKQMSFILENETDYEIYFSHQCDNRNFNRGGTKNIGFLAMKDKYPDDYKDITFIFNDVDTLPFHKIFDYQTTRGIVKHYYGFEFALGGIVVIKGSDFEYINGYPNYWGWGNEDTVLQNRCIRNGIRIDRSNFFKIGSPEILQLFDGVSRLVTPREDKMKMNDNGVDGVTSIRRLTLSIDNESMNKLDNRYVVSNERIKIINILSFLTNVGYNSNDSYNYDLRDPMRMIVKPAETEKTEKIVQNADDWKNFDLKNIQTNQVTRQQAVRQYQVTRPPPHKYSKEYANYIGSKPRATASANIRLGGVVGTSRF